MDAESKCTLEKGVNMKTYTSSRKGETGSNGLPILWSQRITDRKWPLVFFVVAFALSIGFVPVWAEEEDDVVGLRHRVDRLEALLGELQGTVSELEDPLKPEFCTVDCGAGQSVTEALAQAQDHLGLLSIAVRGVCEEAVQITRDNVIIAGVEPGDGILAPSGERALHLEAVRGISLYQLTIDANEGICGINSSDSVFIAMGLTVRGGEICGIGINQGSSASIWNSTIENGPMFGIKVETGGALAFSNSEVHGCLVGVYTQNGGVAEVYSTKVKNNDMGISAFLNGSIRVMQSEINQNRNGIDALQNSTIEVGKSTIADNGAVGAHIGAASMLNIYDTEIVGNATGILVEQGSTVTVFGGTITANVEDGIALQDMSNGLGGWGDAGGPPVKPIRITNNGGWGIRCDGPDDGIKTAQNDFALEFIEFSDNALGDTNCLGGN